MAINKVMVDISTKTVGGKESNYVYDCNSDCMVLRKPLKRWKVSANSKRWKGKNGK